MIYTALLGGEPSLERLRPLMSTRLFYPDPSMRAQVEAMLSVDRATRMGLTTANWDVSPARLQLK